MSQEEIHHRGCLDAQWKSHMIFSRRQLFFNWALLVSEVNMQTKGLRTPNRAFFILLQRSKLEYLDSNDTPHTEAAK